MPKVPILTEFHLLGVSKVAHSILFTHGIASKQSFIFVSIGKPPC